MVVQCVALRVVFFIVKVTIIGSFSVIDRIVERFEAFCFPVWSVPVDERSPFARLTEGCI